MANILSALHASANALDTFDQALQVTQNNVANASTPGYVKHRQALEAMAFDPKGGLAGGVRAGDIQSARSRYADQAVRSQITLEGEAQQQVNSYSSLQSLFDVSGNSGIPSALNQLYRRFSAWAQAPDDPLARQNVIDQASNVAAAFQQTANGLNNLRRQTEQNATDTVTTVNQLAARIQTLNSQARRSSRTDSGMDAELHNALEELAQYVDFTALEQEDGSVNVILNGSTALVVGDEAFPISARMAKPDTPPPVYDEASPSLCLYDSAGNDITAQTKGGQLGALVDMRNRVLPSYLGDAWQEGDLNRMATQFADRVNEILTSGVAADGTQGAALFTYGSNATDTARTLSVDRTSINPAQLGAIQAGPPAVSNGIPLALSALENPQNDRDEIAGASYNQYFGRLAARAGADYEDADSRLKVQQSAVAQAKNLRDEVSGVSLNEEATILIQFQRAYEANSRLITVLDELSQTTINMLQR